MQVDPKHFEYTIIRIRLYILSLRHADRNLINDQKPFSSEVTK